MPNVEWTEALQAQFIGSPVGEAIRAMLDEMERDELSSLEAACMPVMGDEHRVFYRGTLQGVRGIKAALFLLPERPPAEKEQVAW